MELRERVARALWAQDDANDRKRAETMPAWKYVMAPYEAWADDWLAEADAALAALGLDDFDAAVDRGASTLATGVSYNPNKVDAGQWPRIRDDFRAHARGVLEAALSPTESSEL